MLTSDFTTKATDDSVISDAVRVKLDVLYNKLCKHEREINPIQEQEQSFKRKIVVYESSQPY
jgi:hypothetical protein